MQQDKVFQTRYDGARLHIYKMKTTYISMIIIIHMQSRRKSYIFLLEIMTFSDIRVVSCFFENYYYFIYVLSGMYSMTICDKSGIKAVYNYKK